MALVPENTTSEPASPECPPGIVMGEVQLILAEKRTSLAGLRTGIAVAAIPLSIMGLLVATSRYYEIGDVPLLFGAVMAFNALMLALSGYLIVHAVLKLRREDRLIREIKRKHSSVADLID